MTRGKTGPDSALKHGILLAATFFALVPSIFMILTSLKSQDEYTFNKIGLPHALVLVGPPDPEYAGRVRPPVPMDELRRFA